MYRNILIPLDGSDTSLNGLHEAIRLAKGQNSTLHLVHVLMDYPLMVEMASAADFEVSRQRMRQEGEYILAQGLHLAAQAGIECISAVREARGLRVADVLVEQAQREHCGLIVIGSHGRHGFSRAVLGSDAETVARLAPMPVLLVKGPREGAHVE
ncbi:MAG TPA: universal stress protein [Roseateles sp.]|nr:universal stress protein [Roseateles sp.]